MNQQTTTTRTNVLHRGHTIVTVDDVLSPAECEELIAFSEGIGFREAPITTGRGFVMAPEVRDNTRVMVDDPARASELWKRLLNLNLEGAVVIPVERGPWRAVGLNERFRFYRYEGGQRFRWHRDGAFIRSPKERSHLTVLLYLNDGCEGGATEIDLGGPGDDLAISPRAGQALLFEHAVRHQGAPVISGRKYVLRTDVMYLHKTAEL